MSLALPHTNQCFMVKFSPFSEWDDSVQIDGKKASICGILTRQFDVKSHTPAQVVLTNLTATEIKLILERFPDNVPYMQVKELAGKKWQFILQFLETTT